MKKLSNNIKYDIRLLLVTKSFTVILISMIIIFMLSQYNQINKYKLLTKQFNISFEEVKKYGENPEELLKQEYHLEKKIDENSGIQQLIDNHLKYDFELMKESRNDIEGSNIIISLLKNSILLFLSSSVTIYMIFVACFEFAESTFKIRLLMGNSKTITISKLLAGIITVSIAFIISLIISSIVSYIWSITVTKSYPLMYPIEYASIFDILKTVLLTYLILLIYGLIGFSIGLFLRKMSISTILFLIIHMSIPSLGKYDYKNLILTIYHNIFPVPIDDTINYIKGVSVHLSFIILILYSVIIFSLGLLRFKFEKRSGILQ